MAISIEIAKKAIEQARKRPANLRYFFSQLSSPDWIEPLRELGVFAKPLPPIREKGYISFPEWPESRYLVRMADIDPAKVQGVLLDIPETDNVSIHEDYVIAATKVPPRLAVPMAGREARWISQQPALT